MHSHQHEDEEKLSQFFSENAAAFEELKEIGRQFTAYIPTVKRANSPLYMNHYLPFCFNLLNMFLDKLYAFCFDHHIPPDAATLTAMTSTIFESIDITPNQRLFLMQLHDFVRDDLTVHDFHLDKRLREVCINAAQSNFLQLYCGRMVAILNTLTGENRNNDANISAHSKNLIFNLLHKYFKERISDTLLGLPAEFKELGVEIQPDAERHDRLTTQYELLQIAIRDTRLEDMKEKNNDLKLRNVLKEDSIFSRKNANLEKLQLALDRRIVLQEKLESLEEQEKNCVIGLMTTAEKILTAVNHYNCTLPAESDLKESRELTLIMQRALTSLEKHQPKFSEIQKHSPSNLVKK
jgi:hypothetical protein